MRPLLAPLAAGLLASGLAACGGAGRTTGGSASSGSSSSAPSTAVSATATLGSYRPGAYDLQDGDNDPDDRRAPGFVNDEESLFATYGRGASPADTRAIATLVKRYLSAAASGDGAKACAFLDAPLARELVAAGSKESCATVLPALFERQHPRLTASDVATMAVISVHVKGNVGLAELGFRTLPEQELIAEREGHIWKIDALLGNYMP
ncbi:MAG TPA: hypothetical protein VN845_13570 [Solirubrobacteraceae bacterium]|nr:hypothetical protein [Solirubrobacteraceae bacterium]